MPASFLVGSRTSRLCFCCHLHCLLCRLVKFSRKERPDGSLLAFAWSLFRLLSFPLQDGFCLFHPPLSAISSAALANCFPSCGKTTRLSCADYVPCAG